MYIAVVTTTLVQHIFYFTHFFEFVFYFFVYIINARHVYKTIFIDRSSHALSIILNGGLIN